MISIFGVKISFLFVFPCFLLWLICGPIVTGAYLCAIFCHEQSHVIMARALGYKNARVFLSYYGCKAEVEGLDNCELSSELPIAIAGPLFNICLAIIFAFASQVLYFWYYPLMGFAVANLVLGCFNLMPVLPLDGGRILRSIVCSMLPREKGTRLCVRISVAVGVAFIVAFAYYFYYQKYKIFLAVLGIFIILGAVNENRKVSRYRLGIIEHRNKLSDRPKRVRRVAVSCEDDLKMAVSMFKDDCFNVVDVVSEDGNIKKTITEVELIKQLTR